MENIVTGKSVATGKNKERHEETENSEHSTPTVSRFLTIKGWESGGGQVLKDLKTVTGGLEAGGILPEMAADARRDYVQLLLGNTYSLDGQAAINQANNLAFRDTEFADDWEKHNNAKGMGKFIFDLGKQYIDLFAAFQDQKTVTAAARRDILLEKMNKLKKEKRDRVLKTLDADIKTVEQRKSEIFNTITEKRFSDPVRDTLIKDKLKLEDWLEDAQDLKDKFDAGSFIPAAETKWVYLCRMYRAIFSRAIKVDDARNGLPVGTLLTTYQDDQSQLEIMREYWEKTTDFNEDINSWYGKCDNAMKAFHDIFVSTVNKFLKDQPIQELFKSLTGVPKFRKSTSNDDFAPDDSVFDIMIRNNENLITALIGKEDGDANNNLLKTVQDSLKENADSIGGKLDAVKSELQGFQRKLTNKFNAIRTWANGKVGTHTHSVLPAGESIY